MLTPLKRTIEQVRNDSQCIGTCTLNEQDICVGCHRHIEEIIEAENGSVRTTRNS